MKHKQTLFSLTFLFIIVYNFSFAQNFTEKSIPGSDGINIKAEFYSCSNNEKPLVLLFHQAGYSRGEYRETAPKLNELGFNCLAIDQRSGKEVNGVTNESFNQANNKGLETQYINAFADLKSTIDYVLDNNMAKEVILLGSSYSASLVFILGSEYKEKVKGIIAFSPGEYFSYEGKKISDFSKEVKCPVFITSSGSEKKLWEGIFNNINSEKSSFLPDFAGFHGSQALWSKHEGNEKYWKELKKFLKKF